MTTENEWVWLARIRRPQGRKGEVFADVLTDFPEKFAERKRLWLLAGETVENSLPVKGTGLKGTGLKGTGLKGTGLKGTGLKGTGFSPYMSPAKSARALAPEGNIQANSPAVSFPREVTLAAHWPHKGGVVLHFAGVDSISDAETLAGLIVAIPQIERAALAEDEVYIADLIGCTLVDVAGTAPSLIGEIVDVNRTAGPVALLVVNGAAGEVLVPFARDYVRTLDISARRLEMTLPEGLVELNTPESR